MLQGAIGQFQETGVGIPTMAFQLTLEDLVDLVSGRRRQPSLSSRMSASGASPRRAREGTGLYELLLVDQIGLKGQQAEQKIPILVHPRFPEKP